jgi:hypothetical protein
MIFSVGRTRFEWEGSNLRTAPGRETNLLRGALGAALRNTSAQGYSKWFDPRWREGPSGYRDAPRPFVLRWADDAVDLIFFRTSEPVDEIEQAMHAATKQITGAHIRLERMPTLPMPLEGIDAHGNLRLIFATPTELKSDGKILTQPDFFCLMELLAERVRMLGRLYQNWAEEFPFHALLETAKTVKTIDWNWERTDNWRRSARSRQIHSIGGCTGWAEYSGPLGRLLPLLEIGRWTGVGRQTVWGKGEIRIESFRTTE